MKILLLNANRAGVGTYHRALNFGRELARRGHLVTLMTVSNTRRFHSEARRESERFRIVECPNWLDELLPWGASGVLDVLLRIREIVVGQYDVVYAFEYQPNISIPVFVTRRLRRYTLLSDWCDWHAGASYHFGGRRWAFACPRTGRYVAKLYLPYGAEQFWSRRAYGLGYACQRETWRDRAMRRLRRLDRALGGKGDGMPTNIPPKPKWMRWRTYERKAAEWERASDRVEDAWAVTIARFLQRFP